MTELELMKKHPELFALIDSGARPGLLVFLAYQWGAHDHAMEMAERVGIARDKLDHMVAKGTL